MSAKTGIQWTDRTWNPVVGCTKVSQGCKNCYAKSLHDLRHKAYQSGKLQNIPQYAQPFETVQVIESRLPDPLGWRKPSRVFVNSVSDLFHEDVPDVVVAEVFAVMGLASWHTFQVLTKRPERMLYLLKSRSFRELVLGSSQGWAYIAWDAAQRARQFDPQNRLTTDWAAQDHGSLPLRNVWLGVSVENQEAANERIPLLVQTPAAVRFLSCEPLLGPIDFDECGSRGPEDGDPFRFSALAGTDAVEPRIPGIDWVIVGGESGKNGRPFHLHWAREIIAQCGFSGAAPFVKQLGRRPIEDAHALPLNDAHGGDWSEWPADLRVREFPDA